MQVRLFTNLLLLAAACVAQAIRDDPTPTPDCSGHGVLTDGACICSTPLPSAGQLGFVGDQCGTAVYSYDLNTPDVSSDGACAGQPAAPDGLPCNSVAAGWFSSRCFAINISQLHDGSANYIALLFSHKKGNATLRVRGYYTNFDSSPVTYPHWSEPFSFTLIAAPGGAPSHHIVDRLALAGPEQNGLFACVWNGRSSDEATFGLKLASSTCPISLLPNGDPSICSSTPGDERNATASCGVDGWCSCKAPHTRPNTPVDQASGFADCSATVSRLDFAPTTASGGTNTSVAHIPLQAPGSWQYFILPVMWTDYEVSVRAYTTEKPADDAPRSQLEMYMRYYQPPGRSVGQYAAADERDDWDADLAAGLRLTRDNPAFQLAPGVWRLTAYAATWYLGLYVSGPSPVAYTLEVFKFACPNNCSGAGTCVNGTCACSSALFSGPECARSTATLQLDSPLVVPPRSGGSHPGGFLDLLTLPGAAAELHTSGPTAALRITVKTSYGSVPPADWVYSRPALLIARSGPLSSPDEASSRLPLMEPGKEYVLDVDAGLVEGQDLHMSIYNPFSYPYEVGYEVTVARVGHCLKDCSGHGTCGPNGVCVCSDNYAGGDCSVPPGGAVCAVGSSQPEHLADKSATCWHPCKTDGSGFDAAVCADFQCDATGPGGQALRRKGHEEACVSDACLQGTYIIQADTGDSVCKEQCACPADGGPCALAGQCDADTLECLNGLVKQQQADRSYKCVQATSSCDEGALKQVFAVDGGAAFAVCLCTPEGCSYHVPTPAAIREAVLVCSPGYQLQDTTTDALHLSDGTKVTSGGRCARVRPAGTSGGMVFFWCIFSILLALGMVVGGKWAWERWELHRYGLASGYGDAWDHFTNAKQPLVNNNNDRW